LNGHTDSSGKFRPHGHSKGLSSSSFSDNESNSSVDAKAVDDLKNSKSLTMKQFNDSGNYLEDEVRRRAEKGSPHFFDKDTMRFFSSRISELMWKKGTDIYFITSEADRGHIKHSGSTRAFTVRKINADGNIDKVSEFQEHSTLNEARKEIKNIINKGDY